MSLRALEVDWNCLHGQMTLVSPQAKVSSVCTPSCYALCAACDMLPNLPMRVRGAPGALAGGQEEELGHSGTGKVTRLLSVWSQKQTFEA